MKVCVLFNPKAGSAGQVAALRGALAAHGEATFVESKDENDLRRHAIEAGRGGYDVVAVAGGDGTVHTVLNALAPRFPKAPLLVIPLGTGNDLCRTLGLPLDPAAAAALARDGRRRRIDVARVGGGYAGYMANVATGGFSGRVAADTTAEVKQAWGPLAYFRAAAGPVANPQTYALTVWLDGRPPERFDALNLVVANARTAAGGVAVAPQADPEDGELDVVVIRHGDVFDLSVVAARVMAGDYHDDETVAHRRAARVEIESDPPLPLSIDGELVEGRRFTFEVLPKALRVVVGPEYRRDPRTTVPDPDEPDVGRGRLGHRLFGFVATLLFLAVRMPKVYLTGLGVAFATLLGFVAVARGVSEGGLREWNAGVSAAVWSWRSEELTRLAVALTRLGDPLVSVGLTAVAVAGLAAARKYLNAATLLAVLAGCGALELTLKPLFAVARPDLAERLTEAGGYGFPSGHALRSVGLLGFLAALLVAGGPALPLRWLAAAAAAAAALGVCLTRVYLGVHSPTDVIAGALASAGWLSACLAARHYARERLVRRAAKRSPAVAGPG